MSHTPRLNNLALAKAIYRHPWLIKQLGESLDFEIAKQLADKVIIEYEFILKKET